MDYGGLSASWDGTLKVWDLVTGVISTGITLDAPIQYLQLAPDNITIVAGDAGGNVHCLRYVDSRLPTAQVGP